MPNIVVVGTQWGDEGKGKVVDVITPHVNVVVRFQGGNNAGHTVVVGREKYVLHSIPSGILHSGCRCVVGCGVVVDPGTETERTVAIPEMLERPEQVFEDLPARGREIVGRGLVPRRPGGASHA